MEFAARLPSPFLNHLRVVLGRDHSLIEVGEWSELGDVVRNRPIDVVVVDPRGDDGVSLPELRSLTGQFPSLPVVIYTALSPETLGATVELAKLGIRHVVLRNFDDEPRRFLDLLERQPSYAMSDAVLASIARQLGSLPVEMARAIERLFRVPGSFQDVNDLAAAAGMTRRTMDRWLDKAGLAPARMLVLGARMVRAYFYMRDPGRSLGDVSRKMGYGSSRLLARQARAATGLTPSVLRYQMPPDEFVAVLSAKLCRRGGEANAV